MRVSHSTSSQHFKIGMPCRGKIISENDVLKDLLVSNKIREAFSAQIDICSSGVPRSTSVLRGQGSATNPVSVIHNRKALNCQLHIYLVVLFRISRIQLLF
jgi:hypothetical protein